MNLKLTNDLENQVTSAPTGAIQVEGTTGAIYWVLTEEAMRVRQHVQMGIEQAECGDIAPWDSSTIKAKGRELKQDCSD